MRGYDEKRLTLRPVENRPETKESQKQPPNGRIDADGTRTHGNTLGKGGRRIKMHWDGTDTTTKSRCDGKMNGDRVGNKYLFSLKFKRNEKINSKLNILRGLFLFISIILFFGFKFSSVPFIVFLYLILSIINNVK